MKALTPIDLQNQPIQENGSEDEEEEDCCEQSASEDELSASDLEEIQGNIISAIHQFDQIYNQPKGKKKKKKGDKSMPATQKT